MPCCTATAQPKSSVTDLWTHLSARHILFALRGQIRRGGATQKHLACFSRDRDPIDHRLQLQHEEDPPPSNQYDGLWTFTWTAPSLSSACSSTGAAAISGGSFSATHGRNTFNATISSAGVVSGNMTFMNSCGTPFTFAGSATSTNRFTASGSNNVSSWSPVVTR